MKYIVNTTITCYTTGELTMFTYPKSSTS